LNGPLQQDSAGNNGAYCETNENFFPTTRQGITCVKLDSSKIFLFGGFDAWWHQQYASISNDAWIYDFKQNTWTLVSGGLSIYPGSFGIQGVYDSTNEPRSRYGAISWKGAGGTIWIYGGNYYVDDKTESDLWKFTLDTSCISFNVADAIAEHHSEIKIYPNPATSQLEIIFPKIPGVQQLKIVNTLGQLMKREKISSNHFSLNISDLNGGIYLLEIESANDQQVFKFVKQ